MKLKKRRRLKKKKNDSSDDYILNKPTTANVYPPDMMDIVKQYLDEMYNHEEGLIEHLKHSSADKDA